ncbi:MAG: RagB/SusD family nutrient uptake outer membrane protein [Bacteroidota bacterium]
MKNILIIMVLIAGLASCNKTGFLDNKSTTLDETAVFSDSIRTMQFLNRIYADIGFSFTKGRWSSHGNSEFATDDAEYQLSGATQAAVVLYNGTISPTNLPSGLTDFWNLPYTNIRRANLMLSKLPVVPLPEDGNSAVASKKRVKAETRFLRAWYYSQLMIAFGGVPNVGDNVYGIDDVILLPRQNFAELVAYITKELDEAGADLPNTSYDFLDTRDFGRATKGACMALKSRVLLYAASPLFNGGATTTDPNIAKLVSHPSYSVSHWQAAADAAQALINSGYFSLWNPASPIAGFGFYQTFLNSRTSAPTASQNKELIFGMFRPAGKDFESYYNPPSRSGARYSFPTQNLVDAFPMKNGKAITDPTSGYNPATPYLNRDPRFRYTIIFNGSFYMQNNNTQGVVNTFVGAASDGYNTTITGYYSRKMCDSTLAQGGSGSIDRPWPLIRYAEVLLNYAEAINETGQTTLAYDKLKELRMRAGIDIGDGLYGMKAGMTQAEMRAFIQNERRIETSFEDLRWHDIRRWKIAMVVSNGFNRSVKITGTAPNWVYTYVNTSDVQASRLHVFRPEMHLLPIADDEIRKNPAMIQNPGW